MPIYYNCLQGFLSEFDLFWGKLFLLYITPNSPIGRNMKSSHCPMMSKSEKCHSTNSTKDSADCTAIIQSSCGPRSPDKGYDDIKLKKKHPTQKSHFSSNSVRGEVDNQLLSF